jgi:hypothetical protein
LSKGCFGIAPFGTNLRPVEAALARARATDTSHVLAIVFNPNKKKKLKIQNGK